MDSFWIEYKHGPANSLLISMSLLCKATLECPHSRERPSRFNMISTYTMEIDIKSIEAINDFTIIWSMFPLMYIIL